MNNIYISTDEKDVQKFALLAKSHNLCDYFRLKTKVNIFGFMSFLQIITFILNRLLLINIVKINTASNLKSKFYIALLRNYNASIWTCGKDGRWLKHLNLLANWYSVGFIHC
jgi:hypothetical protein